MAQKQEIENFKIESRKVEIVNSYKYLGTFFNANRSFLTTRKHLAQQACKALHLVYKRINNLQLPIVLTLKLFDHTIVPILSCACEVWAYEDINLLEQIHCDFIRKLLNLKKTTPRYMIYAETGRYPLEIIMK